MAIELTAAGLQGQDLPPVRFSPNGTNNSHPVNSNGRPNGNAVPNGGIPANGLRHGFFEPADDTAKPDRRFSTDSVPSSSSDRSRRVIQRSLTMVEATRPQRPRIVRQPRTVSMSEPPEDYWRRRGSRRLSFCPRGSLFEVIQDLPPVLPSLPTLNEVEEAKTVPELGGFPPLPSPEKLAAEEPVEEPVETPLAILTQVFVPFILAGLGMVAAGVLLNQVKYWRVFIDIPELMVMVPPLLGLKGNLEMTLACRMSTQANLGNMDTRSAQLSIAGGNLALIQCQAVIAGLVAALLAIIKSLASSGVVDGSHVLTLATSAVLTAELASIVLASVMVLVIFVCQRLRVNPDNVATPVAASLGDIITLALLAGSATLLHVTLGHHHWVAGILLGVTIFLVPVWAFLAHRNIYTREVLSQGWLPILLAIVVSSGGGYILEFASNKYEGLAAYQPVINGVGGNLVAVQASRISTYLHLNAERRGLPPGESRCVGITGVFFGGCLHARTARLLLLLLIPGQLIFVAVIDNVEGNGEAFHGPFVGLYLAAAFIQVCVLLYVARVLVYSLWTRGVDPDNAAIPFLTALGDLLGGGLLAVVFWLLEFL